MPGPVKAARLILLVTAGLVGVALLMNLLGLFYLLGLPAQDQQELVSGTGTGPDDILLRFGIGAVSAAALLAAGLLLPRGGRRTHLVVRLLTGGAALVTVAGALVTDRAAAMVVLSPLIVLILLQLRPSHEWFAATDPS
jgi:hypothetical protein